MANGRLVEEFPTPVRGPNGLQWTDEGLWVMDQWTDDAYLLSEQGDVIKTFGTVTENASGVTFGDGALWTASNGVTQGRPYRSWDTHLGWVMKLDPDSGELIDRWRTPDGGGIHGIEWDEGLLWVTAFQPKALWLVDPNDDFKMVRKFEVRWDRLHGLARDGDGIWCAHTSDKVIVKYEVETGEEMEIIKLDPDGPSPHGLSMKDGDLWYGDANFAGKQAHAVRDGGQEIGKVDWE